jgi:hypothetical protein
LCADAAIEAFHQGVFSSQSGCHELHFVNPERAAYLALFGTSAAFAAFAALAMSAVAAYALVLQLGFSICF